MLTIGKFIAGRHLAFLRTPAARNRFAELGVDAAPLAYAEFDAFFRAEIAKWGQFIERAGIHEE